MDRLMSDGYPFIFQMIDKSESDIVQKMMR